MKKAIVLYVTGFVAAVAGISYHFTRPAVERAETYFDATTLVMVVLAGMLIATATMITHPPVSRYELRDQLAEAEERISVLEKAVPDS